MISSDDSLKLHKLLMDLKVDLNNCFIKPIGLGKNNRTYFVSTNENKFLAKFYYSSSKDSRTRLSNEFNFLEYLEEIGINNAPKPVIRSDLYNLGIYEFIEGRPFSSSDLNEDSILSAASFFSSINNKEFISNARQLDFASEAFLDLDKSIKQIDERIETLKSLTKQQSQNMKAFNFLLDLQNTWLNIKLDLSSNRDLIMNHNYLCVSPSDFGFHNTLIKNGQLYFLDFEYAGRDDPAKFIADFFIQPEIKVDLNYMKLFADKALDFSDNKDIIIDRTIKLLPMFKVKWCCIMMNEFLPEVAQRRVFSNPELDLEESKCKQLEKAKALLLEVNKYS
jgi:hypothetical protein